MSIGMVIGLVIACSKPKVHYDINGNRIPSPNERGWVDPETLCEDDTTGIFRVKRKYPSVEKGGAYSPAPIKIDITYPKNEEKPTA